MRNPSKYLNKFNLTLITSGLLLSLLLIWLASLELKYQLGRTGQDAATRQAIAIRLEQSLQRHPGSFVTDPQAWEHYINNARKLWDHIKADRSATDKEKPIDRLMALQSEISNLQTELMRIRALKDSIAYRIDALSASVELILGNQLQTSDSATNTLHVIALKEQLSRYDFTSRTYWQPGTDRQSAIEMLEQQLKAARSTATDLIDGEHKLTRAGSRREMLAVINNLDQLEEHTARFTQASNLFTRMETAQKEIDGLGKQILAADTAPEKPDTPLPPILLLILIAVPGIWLGICLALVKQQATELNAGQNARNAATKAPRQNAPRASADFDPANLLLALELGAKGNLSHRMDDREPGAREIAIAYNQMMSTLYRKLIEINRDAAKAVGLMDATTSRKTTPDSDKQGPGGISSLPKAIELTLEIAGISDQLFRKLEPVEKNGAIAGEPLQSLISRLEKNQALIRAILRDHLDQTGAPSRPGEPSTPGGKTLQQLKPAIDELQNLMERLKFFKLDKRL